MKTKTFSNGLVVKYRRSAIILENETGKDKDRDRFDYNFTPEEFQEFITYMHTASMKAWKHVQPKEAHSLESDFNEYYDRRYDNNGYLLIADNGLIIEAPFFSEDTLYQFNKAKVQSFLYELQLLRK